MTGEPVFANAVAHAELPQLCYTINKHANTIHVWTFDYFGAARNEGPRAAHAVRDWRERYRPQSQGGGGEKEREVLGG